jgi:hypothetical protein
MHIDEILIVGFFVLGTYKLFELFVRKGERLAIIEKLFTLTENKEVSGSIKLPDISLGSNFNFDSWSLRISLLLIGIGLGSLLSFFTQYYLFDFYQTLNIDENSWAVSNRISDIKTFTNFSFISIFGGTGLLIAYLIESKQAKNK